MAFKVGDKVLLDTQKGACTNGEFTVSECDGSNNHNCGDPVINYGSGYCHCYKGWKLISSANETMANLVELTKEQQALYRVGITDSYGNVNSSQALSALVRVNRAALVKQAEADIAEAEAEIEKAKSK